jgi:predicted RecB family nuclease
VIGAILFSGLVMEGMDRWTVDSYHPGLARSVRFNALDDGRLRAAGLRTLDEVAEIEANDLAHRVGIDSMTAVRWVNHARLSLFRGIGAPNAAALKAAGLETICDLAEAEPTHVRDAIRARRGDPRAGADARIRVWQRAARRECEA